MTVGQELHAMQEPTAQQPMAEEPLPVVTVTREELQDLVASLIAQELGALGLERPTPEATVTPAASPPAPDRSRRPGESEMERPMASDLGAPSLVPVYVLKPLHENGTDCLRGSRSRHSRLAHNGSRSSGCAHSTLAAPGQCRYRCRACRRPPG